MTKVTSIISKTSVTKSADGKTIEIIGAVDDSKAYDENGVEFTFSKSALESYANTWTDGYVNINHNQKYNNEGMISKAWYHTSSVHMTLELSDEAINLLNSKMYEGWSQECDVIKVDDKNNILEFIGKGVSELIAITPACPKKQCGITGKSDINSNLGSPFGDYKDFDDCVKKNQDKKDPEGYCAVIKQKTEGDNITDEIKSSNEKKKQISDILQSQMSDEECTMMMQKIANMDYKDLSKLGDMMFIKDGTYGTMGQDMQKMLIQMMIMDDKTRPLMKEMMDNMNDPDNKTKNNKSNSTTSNSYAAQAGDSMTEDIKKYTDEIQSLKSEAQTLKTETTTLKTESEAQKTKITELESAVKEKDTALVQAQARLAQIDQEERNKLADEIVSIGSKKKKEELSIMSKDVLTLLRDELKEIKPVASKKEAKPGFQITESAKDRIEAGRSKLSSMYVGPGVNKQD